jgi:hypothetical protein
MIIIMQPDKLTEGTMTSNSTPLPPDTSTNKRGSHCLGKEAPDHHHHISTYYWLEMPSCKGRLSYAMLR